MCVTVFAKDAYTLVCQQTTDILALIMISQGVRYITRHKDGKSPAQVVLSHFAVKCQ